MLKYNHSKLLFQSLYDDGTEMTRKQLLMGGDCLRVAPEGCLDQLLEIWKSVVRRVYLLYQLSAKAYFLFLQLNDLVSQLCFLHYEVYYFYKWLLIPQFANCQSSLNLPFFICVVPFNVKVCVFVYVCFWVSFHFVSVFSPFHLPFCLSASQSIVDFFIIISLSFDFDYCPCNCLDGRWRKWRWEHNSYAATAASSGQACMGASGCLGDWACPHTHSSLEGSVVLQIHGHVHVLDYLLC